jgi:TolB protein
MLNRTEERVRGFLDQMSAQVHDVDPAIPPRVRRRSLLGMATWAGLTVLAAGAVPALAFAALHSAPESPRRHVAGSNPTAGAQIAYTRGNRIWVMNTDGADPHALSPEGIGAMEPDWSPDGSRMVFVGDGRIVVMNADGGDLTREPATSGGDPVSPQWSPDGTSVAFDDALSSGRGRGLYLMNLADGSVRLLTDQASDSLISWSPDGTEIAFTREQSDVANVWAVDVATGALRQITDDGFGWDPAWSPDGNQIAYFHDSQIWVANADGTGHGRPVTIIHGQEAFAPHWSPDGRWITFYSGSGHNDLYRIHPDGTGLTQLTDTPQLEKGGDWRPPA